MSSPSINRWGLNLFWYRFWYVDKSANFLLTQDDLINRLVIIYLHYGLVYNKSIFLNKYWYSSLNLSNEINADLNTKYFRVVEYKNKFLKETRLCKLRIKLKNIYFSKLWILRYQNWLVINFFSYQPLKKKKTFILNNTKTSSIYLRPKSEISFKKYYRIRFFILNVVKASLFKNTYYNF